MKEATGELNMTVITIVAIAAIGALLWAMWPSIESSIRNAWGGGVTGDCQAGWHVSPTTGECVPNNPNQS